MQTKHLFFLIHFRNKDELVPSNMFKPSSNFLLRILFVIGVSWHTILPCGHLTGKN